MNKKEKSEWKRSRVKSELTLTLIQLLNNFKSKEEPRVKLTLVDKVEVLLKLATNEIPRLTTPKKKS